MQDSIFDVEIFVRILYNLFKIAIGIFSLFLIITTALLTEITFETNMDKEAGIVMGILIGLWTYDKVKYLKEFLLEKIEKLLGGNLE